MTIFDKLDTYKNDLAEYHVNPDESKKQRLIAIRNGILNSAPESHMIENRQGISYIPISVIETILDLLFDPFGWSFEIVGTQIVANEFVINGVLTATCPITNNTIKRSGIAASQIRMKQGANVTEIEKKIVNAMEMDAPHAKSDCLKNAASTLGKLFGSDINRNKGTGTAAQLNERAKIKKIPKKMLLNGGLELLTSKHEKWQHCVSALGREEATILQLESRFIIPDETKTLLTDAAIEYQQKTVPKATN